MTTKQRKRRRTPKRDLTTNGTSNNMQPDRQPTTNEPQQPQFAEDNDRQLAKFLGYFSIGLCVAQLLMPRRVARFIGLRGDLKTVTIMRMVGLRELMAGIGIFTQPRPAAWVQARVMGDAMDLALLGAARRSNKVDHGRITAAMAAVTGIAALDWLDSEWLSRDKEAPPVGMSTRRPMHVKQSLTINRPVDDVYRFWHYFENLPRFMSHLESVTITGDKQSHWKANAPAGLTVEWDAVTIEDMPNEIITWQSLEGATVPNAGTVRFTPAPGDQGTEIKVDIWYDPPGGAIGATFAKLFGEEPSQQLYDDLRRFKQVMETGEVVLSEATVVGTQLLQRPAQPPTQAPQSSTMESSTAVV